MALLARTALAAVATTAAPRSLREALMPKRGAWGTETLTAALALVAPLALRPVNEGMATAAEVTAAMSVR